MKDILIFAESATLAHILRAKYVADAINKEYNIIFAISKEYYKYVRDYQCIELKESITSKEFLNNINKNKPIFNYATLKNQYAENRKIIDKYCPDLVVGDMRLSLLINRLNNNNFKYVNLTNSYFNPNLHLYRKEYPIPYSPYGRRISNFCYKLFGNYLLDRHIKSPNRLLDNKINNFLYFYFLADVILTFDDSYIFKHDNLKENDYIDYKLYDIGYLDISLENSNKAPNSEYIYINLGSSLTSFLISDMIKICSKIKKYNFIISTLDNRNIKYNNIKTIDYGNVNLVKNSILNINNSGILSVGQNLIYDKKQICIPHNFDQHLVFKHFKDKKLVDGLSSDNLSYRKLKHKIEEVLHNGYMKKNISNYSMSMQGNSSTDKIKAIFRRIQ